MGEVFMLIAVQAVVITSSPCSTSFSKLLNVLNRVTSNQIVKRNMAWRSHGSTNEELVTKLRANGVISSDKVEQVMKSIDRGDFCKSNPYNDAPQGIGYGVTISAPHMHAYALEHLKDQLIEGNRASVLGIDHMKELVDWSVSNVKKNHEDLLKSGQIKLVVGDGRQGHAQNGPYHAIHVGAAAPSLPQALVDQLAP